MHPGSAFTLRFGHTFAALVAFFWIGCYTHTRTLRSLHVLLILPAVAFIFGLVDFSCTFRRYYRLPPSSSRCYRWFGLRTRLVHGSHPLRVSSQFYVSYPDGWFRSRSTHRFVTFTVPFRVLPLRCGWIGLRFAFMRFARLPLLRCVLRWITHYRCCLRFLDSPITFTVTRVALRCTLFTRLHRCPFVYRSGCYTDYVIAVFVLVNPLLWFAVTFAVDLRFTRYCGLPGLHDSFVYCVCRFTFAAGFRTPCVLIGCVLPGLHVCLRCRLQLRFAVCWVSSTLPYTARVVF